MGLLGQNVFRIADVEYDLANGVIRLAQPRDCKNIPLAYWAQAEHKELFDARALILQPRMSRIRSAIAYLNGEKIRVDVRYRRRHVHNNAGCGQARRHHALAAQESSTREIYLGFGHRIVKTWIATFASFKIGDEEIQHARLRFGDVNLVGNDMLIGPDFFLSHRIYVASSQRKMYFTYNGGPVFDLRTAPTPETGASGADAAPGAAPSEMHAERGRAIRRPDRCVGFARRGAASAARMTMLAPSLI